MTTNEVIEIILRPENRDAIRDGNTLLGERAMRAVATEARIEILAAVPMINDAVAELGGVSNHRRVQSKGLRPGRWHPSSVTYIWEWRVPSA